MYDKKLTDAMGAAQMAKLTKSEGDVFDSVETTFFRVSPIMSYLPAEVEAVDPDFWHPKPAANPAAPAPKPSGQ